MGKDQELLQAVKTEDLLTVQKLLQRPKPGKASRDNFVFECMFSYSLKLKGGKATFCELKHHMS